MTNRDRTCGMWMMEIQGGGYMNNPLINLTFNKPRKTPINSMT